MTDISGFRNACQAQSRVIGALILRDMRTRFGRSALGYVVAIAWPLTHLVALVASWTLLGHVVPLGTSGPIFFATGVMPYILCLYPARMMMFAVAENKPLLLFPVVKISDIILARGILELITAFCVLISFCFLLFLAGIDFFPRYPEQAILAVAATVFYSLSVGFLNCIIMTIFKMWSVVFIIVMIGQWLASGATFLPSLLSPDMQKMLSYNPMLHCIEWLRSAYYDGYGEGLLDRGYLFNVSLICLVIGFIGERAVRGRLLMQ